LCVTPRLPDWAAAMPHCFAGFAVPESALPGIGGSRPGRPSLELALG
jgi:hypothetical protein